MYYYNRMKQMKDTLSKYRDFSLWFTEVNIKIRSVVSTQHLEGAESSAHDSSRCNTCSPCTTVALRLSAD